MSICCEILAEINQGYHYRIQYFAYEVTKVFIVLHTYIYMNSKYVLHVNIGTFPLQPARVGTLKFPVNLFLRTNVNFLTNYTASLQTRRQYSFVNLISILFDIFSLI